MKLQSNHVAECIRQASLALTEHHVEAPLRAATLIMCHVLGITQVQLLAGRDADSLTEQALQKYQKLIERRKNHEPLAYILGTKEFYGLDFEVSNHVLIPRPETELLVDWVLETFGPDQSFRLCDVGCGSGAIVVSVAKHRSKALCLAIDRSEKALEVTMHNAQRLGVQIEGMQSNLLEGVSRVFEVVVSNLPYVPTSDLSTLAPELAHEPVMALDGGEDGLNLIRPLIAQLEPRLTQEGWVFLEYGQGQTGAIGKCLKEHGFDTVEVRKDAAGIERVIRAKRTSVV
ncbi:MAG: peptide chain release factor N(5)-glutamine methyltransferase [Bdellovibrionota bacterium]